MSTQIQLQKSWPRYETSTIDEFTKRLEELALQIARVANKENKQYAIGSGLAIEFYKGKISRNHHDIDFTPLISDVHWWIDWFKTQGYSVTKYDKNISDNAYGIKGSEGELLVDLWPVNEQEMQSLQTQQVEYKEVPIKIEDPVRVLRSKIKHAQKHFEGKLRIQDIHDFENFGKSPQELTP